MLKNNIYVHKINKKYTIKKINKIILKKKFSKSKQIFIILKNLKNLKINKTIINKKCIFTNKNKKMLNLINISRWFISKKNLKFNLNKW